jgi:predicted nucleic acid-binding protein
VISRRVVNASPVIHLTEVGLLDALHEPGVPLLVPDVVLNEIAGRGLDDPAVVAVQQADWITVVSTPAIPPEVVAWGIDAGESAVLAVSLAEFGSQAILDDRAAGAVRTR